MMSAPFHTLGTNRRALDDFLTTHHGHVAQSQLFELFCYVAASLAAIEEMIVQAKTPSPGKAPQHDAQD